MSIFRNKHRCTWSNWTDYIVAIQYKPPGITNDIFIRHEQEWRQWRKCDDCGLVEIKIPMIKRF